MSDWGSQLFLEIVDDYSRPKSSWHEIIKQHQNSKPSVPFSEYIAPRSRILENSSTKPKQEPDRKIKTNHESSVKSPGSSLKPHWSLILDTTSFPNSGTSHYQYVPCKIDSVKRKLKNSKSISIAERKSDPMFWNGSTNPTDSMVTIHRPISCSPGPKYVLGPPVITRGYKSSAREQQRCTSPSKEYTFTREERMLDEPHRSPGPKFYPPHHKGVASQHRLPSPILHGSARHLNGSIYYDGFNSPTRSKLYNTTEKFHCESKRRSVSGVVLGRPQSGVTSTKTPPIRPNTRY